MLIKISGYFRGTKPSSLSGGASKETRARYKSEKGMGAKSTAAKSSTFKAGVPKTILREYNRQYKLLKKAGAKRDGLKLLRKIQLENADILLGINSLNSRLQNLTKNPQLVYSNEVNALITRVIRLQQKTDPHLAMLADKKTKVLITEKNANDIGHFISNKLQGLYGWIGQFEETNEIKQLQAVIMQLGMSKPKK